MLDPSVTNPRWTSKTLLEWDEELAATEYHVYRDAMGTLTYGNFGTCRDDLDPDRTDEQLTDAELPLPGQGFVYSITADDGVNEGSLGLASCIERSNFTPCP